MGHLSQRVATYRQSFSLPNMISHRCPGVHREAVSREGRLRRLCRRSSCFTGFLRCFRPGMQARILGLRAARRHQAGCSARPVTNGLRGRPWLSQMACNFVFMPPLVQPARRPRAPFHTHARRRLVSFEIRCVDQNGLLFAMPGGQTRQHLGEDALIAPALHTGVECLVRAVCTRRVAPP